MGLEPSSYREGRQAFTYKGYIGSAFWDGDAGFHYGGVVNMKDTITYQGYGLNNLYEEMKRSVEDYLEFCRNSGKEPQAPYPLLPEPSPLMPMVQLNRITIRVQPILQSTPTGQRSEYIATCDAFPQFTRDQLFVYPKEAEALGALIMELQDMEDKPLLKSTLDIQFLDEEFEEETEPTGDDLCDLCYSSGVNVDRTTYCGKTIGIECGCDETCQDSYCGNPDCEPCQRQEFDEP